MRCRGGRRWSTGDWDRCDNWDRGFWRGSLRRSLRRLTWDSCDSWDRGLWRGCAGGDGGLRQAGVPKGGIEATRRADYLRLPGMNHALQQFAHVFVAEAGDAGQAAGVHGRGALLQRAQDGLLQQ